eukprot:4513270-Lingulodinium_polyedra.AAC.1
MPTFVPRCSAQLTCSTRPLPRTTMLSQPLATSCHVQLPNTLSAVRRSAPAVQLDVMQCSTKAALLAVMQCSSRNCSAGCNAMQSTASTAAMPGCQLHS